MKNQKGITLISLVITIIVLLILAMIVIGMLKGENGILGQANEASEETRRAKAEEQVRLAVLASNEGTSDLNDEILVDELYKISKEITDIDDVIIEKNTVDLTNRYAINVIVDGYGFEIEEVGTVKNLGKTSGTVSGEELSTSLGDGKWTGNVNEPNLGEGMSPIAWDEESNEIIPTSSQEWYNYEEQTGETDGKTSKWANAKTSDGSYWVWIPRYEYKITYNVETNKSAGGSIDINFIPTSKTEATSGYKIHPAFEDGSVNGKNNNYRNGEWDKELAGIWVMKFEASTEEGRFLSGYNEKYVASSLPNVVSWNWLTVGQAYTEGIECIPELGSHLTKNSEWGAITYLTYSKYGRNGSNPSFNNSLNSGYYYYTGQQNYKQNVTQSSTGNVYGIYDLAGGTSEYVAAYLAAGKSFSNGSNFTNTAANINNYQEYNTKYVTVYPYNSDYYDTSYTIYTGLTTVIPEYGYGDAIIETSSTSPRASSWNNGPTNYFSDVQPFMLRPALLNGNLFSYRGETGKAHNSFGYRVILAF